MSRNPTNAGVPAARIRAAGTLLLAAVTAGCASSGLNQGRAAVYRRDPIAAVHAMEEDDSRLGNRVLFLMERGMAHQLAGQYSKSSRDWNDAATLIEELDYYSVSRGAASFVISDRTHAFRGAHYEQALLHAFNAKNYFAREHWDGAAVEARILVEKLEELNGFPDEPYSRYVAATAFQLIGSHDSAAIEYTQVGELREDLVIDPRTGRFDDMDPPGGAELICFIGLGGAPAETGVPRGYGRWGPAPYVEIEVDGQIAGRSRMLSRTTDLLRDTDSRLAALRTAKTVSRIIVKESIAYSIWRENPVLGELVRLALYVAEVPDTRRWETLPLYLQVARVPFPPEATEFTVIFRDTGGRELARRHVTAPIARRGPVAVSFLREI